MGRLFPRERELTDVLFRYIVIDKFPKKGHTCSNFMSSSNKMPEYQRKIFKPYKTQHKIIYRDCIRIVIVWIVIGRIVGILDFYTPHFVQDIMVLCVCW